MDKSDIQLQSLLSDILQQIKLLQEALALLKKP